VNKPLSMAEGKLAAAETARARLRERLDAGQIGLRKIDGWRKIAAVLSRQTMAA